MLNCTTEDEVGTDCKACPSLSGLAVDSYHAFGVLCQVKHLIENQFENLSNRPRVVIDEGKVGELDFAICDREHFCVHEVVVTHIVDLNTAVVIGIKELHDIILAVPEQFIEALSRQTHRYHTVGDVTKIEVKPIVLVSVTVPGDQSFKNEAFLRLVFCSFAFVDLHH